jgi:L-lactate dehydrogenase
MKAGIVGIGAVGRAIAMAMAVRARIGELVLVNRNRAVAKGVATDMRYGLPLGPLVRVCDGDYADLAGAGVVLLAAGVNEKAGGAIDRDDPLGRLKLLEPNAKVYADVVPRIVEAAPDATIIVVTDPPDPLTDVARYYAGHDRVFGTGTTLDSLRFRVHLAQKLGVSPSHVEANVIGEHGTSSVFLWSAARVGGMDLGELLQQRGIDFEAFRREIEHDVRYANITIIEGIGASQYGIGIVSARLAEAVLRDEHAVFAVGSLQPRYDVTLSLPSVVGKEGVREVLCPRMSDEESRALDKGAGRLNDALRRFTDTRTRTTSP